MKPAVDVLLACYNGEEWISEQIDSILDQNGVEVTIFVSDDGSTDATMTILENRAASDKRIVIAPRRVGPSGSAHNFLYLLQLVAHRNNPVAFADQDDIWDLEKLITQLRISRRDRARAVSCSINSLSVDGNFQLIRKDYPQTALDPIFESAGPGCSYLLMPEAAQLVRKVMSGLDLSEVGFHDWFVYAVIRGAGWNWTIDAKPLVIYRQHQNNVFGANRGIGAKLARLRLLTDGWYRAQFLLMARAASLAAYENKNTYGAELYLGMARLLRSHSFRSRVAIAALAGHLRRRRRDGIVLAVLCLIGMW